MPAITTREVFPKRNVVEKDGWKITIDFKGVYPSFVMGIAQAGDPRGRVTLEGPGRKKVKTPLLNLNGSGNGADVNDSLKAGLINRYNVELDVAFIYQTV